MKKILAFAIIALLTSPAFADTQAIQDIHTTANGTEITLKNVFTLADTPWLYVDVPARPDSNSKKLNIDASWFYGSEVTPRGTSNFNNGNTADDTQFLPAPINWESIEAAGNWRVDAVYTWKNGNTTNRTGTGSTTFSISAPTVTPEPVSMALFGMGAGALGLTRLRRRKKA